ncbi:MAG TPA: response regulator [Candidatus Binatia bacterium]|nr:response regulator [Candidatus Binatia bacterium]
MTKDGEEGLFGLEGRRLLLVEDNDACADAVREWLEICGAHVTTAGTVGSAVARSRREVPDLLLVDVYLPDGTGWDVVDRVRASLPAAIPAVAITGAPTPALVRSAHQHGVRHVIGKPIAPEALAAALAECLEVSAPADA